MDRKTGDTGHAGAEPAAPAGPGLSRSLSLPQLLFYGVGTIVGAGIYTIVGEAAGEAGRATWVSLLLAAGVALVTALSYAELVSAFPRAGAEYQFLKAAFPRWRVPAFLAGYLIALNAAATSATVALAFAGYLAVFWALPAAPVALVLLGACTLLNIAGIRQATWIGIALIAIEVGGLGLFVGMGLAQRELMAGVQWPEATQWPAVFGATALIFFIYIGFEDVANLAEESRHPQRDVPRALIASVVLVSLLYLLVVWVALGIAEPGDMAGSRSPLTDVGRRLAPWLGVTLAVAALFATASTALISLVSISRLLYGMARDGDMPQALSRTLSRRKTPWVAALCLFGAACALVPLGEVKTIASLSALGVLLVFFGVHLALIRLRWSQPALERPFRVWGAAGRLPLLPVAGALCCAALATRFDALVYGVFALALGLGLAAYAAMRWWGRRQAPSAAR